MLRAAEWWKAGSQPVVALFMGCIADAGARLWGQMLGLVAALQVADCRIMNYKLSHWKTGVAHWKAHQG
jgi:succinyl-CoA synthetase alpha subunit